MSPWPGLLSRLAWPPRSLPRNACPSGHVFPYQAGEGREEEASWSLPSPQGEGRSQEFLPVSLRSVLQELPEAARAKPQSGGLTQVYSTVSETRTLHPMRQRATLPLKFLGEEPAEPLPAAGVAGDAWRVDTSCQSAPVLAMFSPCVFTSAF